METQENSSMDVQDESGEESEFPTDSRSVDPRIQEFLKKALGKPVNDDEVNSEPEDDDELEGGLSPEIDTMDDDRDELGNSESFTDNPQTLEMYKIRICELEQDIGFLKQSIAGVYDVFRCFNDLVLDIDIGSIPDLVYFLEKLSDHMRETESLKQDVELDLADEESSERKELEKQIFDVVEKCTTCQGVVEKMTQLFDKIKAMKRKVDFSSPLGKKMKGIKFDQSPMFPEFQKDIDGQKTSKPAYLEIGGVRDYFGLPSIQGENGEEVIYSGQVFDMEQYLKQNGVKRRPVKYHCGLCSKVFSKLKYVKSHYNHQHVNHKKLYCSLCGLSFSYKSNLTRHQKLIHMGDRKEKCNMCEAAFGTRMQLDSHMRKYHDAPKLNCPKCGQTFIQEQSLRNHNEVCPANDNHVKVMCGICMKSFSAKRYLQNHIRAKHTDRVPRKYNCDICGKSFSGQFALKRHRVNKHKDECTNLAISEDLENGIFDDSTGLMAAGMMPDDEGEIDESENAEFEGDMEEGLMEEGDEEEGMSNRFNRFMMPHERFALQKAMENEALMKTGGKSKSKKSATPRKRKRENTEDYTEIKQEVIAVEYYKSLGLSIPGELDKQSTDSPINGTATTQSHTLDTNESSPADKPKVVKEKSRRKSTKPKPKIQQKNTIVDGKSVEIISRNVGADDYDNILINQELGLFGGMDHCKPNSFNETETTETSQQPNKGEISEECAISFAKDKTYSQIPRRSEDIFESKIKLEAESVSPPSHVENRMDEKKADKPLGINSMNESIDLTPGSHHLVYKDQGKSEGPNVHSVLQMNPAHSLFSMERSKMDFSQFRMEPRSESSLGGVKIETPPSSRGSNSGFHVDTKDSINDCNEKGASSGVQQFSMDKVGGGLSPGSSRDVREARDAGMGVQKEVGETAVSSVAQRENLSFPGTPLNLSSEFDMRSPSVGSNFPSMLNTNFDLRGFDQIRTGFSPSPFEGYSNYGSLRPNMMTGPYNNFRPGFGLPSNAGGRLPFDPRAYGNAGMNVTSQAYEQLFGNPSLPSNRSDPWAKSQRRNAPE